MKTIWRYSNQRQWLLAGLALGLTTAGLIFLAPLPNERASNKATPPDSLSAYLLKTEDRQILAAWIKLRDQASPDSWREWLRQHYGPFQSIGLRLMEQATLFQDEGKAPIAAAKFDTAHTIGAALAEAVRDSFLLRQSQRLENLDKKSLRSRVQASLLFASAEASLFASQYEDAISQYKRALLLAQQINDDKLAIDAGYRLLYFLDRHGKDQTVIDEGEKIIAKAEQVDYQWRLALALCSVANAHINLGRHADALKLLEKSIETAELLRDRKVLARAYHNQARIYYHRQEYQPAEILFQKVLENDSEKKFSGLANLLRGHIDVMRGEYGRAQAHYERALKFFQEYDLDNLNEAFTLNRLAVLNILTGDHEKALRLEKEALALREKEKNPAALAQSFSNLGFIYSKMDSLDQAIDMCQRALTLFKSEDKRIAVANTWLNLGKSSLKKIDLNAARSAFSNAENIAKTFPDHASEVVEAKIGHGQIFLQKGQFKQARDYFTSAFDLAQKNGEPTFMAEALWGLSQAEQKSNHLDRALACLDRAIAVTEDLRSNLAHDEVRVNYFATTQTIFNQAILLALAQRHDDLAWHYAERGRSRALRDALTSPIVKELAPDQIALINSSQPDFQVLQRRIPDYAQVIEYRLTTDTLLIGLIDRQKVMTRRVAISSQALAEIIHEFLQSLGAENLDAFKARVQDEPQAVYKENRRWGHRLYQLLWEPIADAVAPNKRLFIIPDGALHHVPFSALVTNDDHFFEERYIWVKAPSLTILSENSDKQLSLGQPTSVKFLMIADNLPTVSAERRLLSKLFVNPSFLIKEEATYTTLQQRLCEGAHIVYFSVHAVADERFPMNSYVELYNNAGDPGHVQKTRVYARELLQLDFSKTRLMVLNACETASGKIAAGEGVLNLVRIFALGKVPTVIASLWKNDDRFSAHITGDFFKGITASEEYAVALHQAKIKARQKLQQDYQLALPYFWAMFEVYQNSWFDSTQARTH